jgi:hypothetical protein
MVLELTYGLLEENTTDIGNKILCMVQEYIFTLMESGMKGNLPMTKRMDSAYTSGLMGGSTKVGGTMVSNKVSVFIQILKRKSMAFGERDKS